MLRYVELWFYCFNSFISSTLTWLSCLGSHVTFSARKRNTENLSEEKGLKRISVRPDFYFCRDNLISLPSTEAWGNLNMNMNNPSNFNCSRLILADSPCHNIPLSTPVKKSIKEFNVRDNPCQRQLPQACHGFHRYRNITAPTTPNALKLHCSQTTKNRHLSPTHHHQRPEQSYTLHLTSSSSSSILPQFPCHWAFVC